MRVALAAIALLVPATLHAQMPATALVVVDDGEPPPLSLLRAIEGAEVDGTTVLSGSALVLMTEVRWAIETNRSAPGDLEEQVAAFRAAARPPEEIRRAIDRALDDYERFVATWGRDDVVARRYFELCLQRADFTVNPLPDEVPDAVARCRRIVPDLSPTEGHTTEVVESLAQLDQGGRLGTLTRIEGPPGCPVLLNGRRAGTAPYEWNAIPGQYSVQLTCEEKDSRSHILVVGSEPTVFKVDPEFDARVEVTPEGIRIRGPVDPVRYGQLFAAMLRIERAMLVSRASNGEWQLTVTRQNGAHREVHVPRAPTVQDVLDAVARLEAQSDVMSQERPSVEVVEYSGEGTPTQLAPPFFTPRRLGFGISLLTIGAAGITAAWFLAATRTDSENALSRADPLAPGFVGLSEDIDRERALLWSFASVGGVALAAGLPMLVRSRRGARIAAWVVGAIGVGLVGGAIPTFLADRECIDELCNTRTAPYMTGVALVSTALPMLVLPIVLQSRREVRLAVSASGVRVRW
ncbi:MAG: hypothetical protein AAF411_16665 [Myxococcota bacterium]